MSRKMYIYRCDYNDHHGKNVRFFYARNAKVGKEFCRQQFDREDGGKPEQIRLNKIGMMMLDVGSHDAALMDKDEEMRLILEDYGAGVKYAERDDSDTFFKPATEGD